LADKPFFSSNCAFVFAVQGFLGSLACGIIRAIRDNAASIFNYNGQVTTITKLYPYPYQWFGAGEFYRACFITFGIALGAGFLCSIFVWLVSGQEHHDYY
jgi:hypothetical protein